MPNAWHAEDGERTGHQPGHAVVHRRLGQVQERPSGHRGHDTVQLQAAISQGMKR
jgi:hypothetical protein